MEMLSRAYIQHPFVLGLCTQNKKIHIFVYLFINLIELHNKHNNSEFAPTALHCEI